MLGHPAQAGTGERQRGRHLSNAGLPMKAEGPVHPPKGSL